MVWPERFELSTPASQTRCATKLRYGQSPHRTGWARGARPRVASMTKSPADRGNSAQLVSITVADDPAAWAAAGFTVTNGNHVHIGDTIFELAGRAHEARGITSWRLAGLDSSLATGWSDGLDGLPTELIDQPDGPRDHLGQDRGPDSAHPNGVIGLDHVVVATPDLERTIAALGEVGLKCRRIRETTSYGSPMRQAFFRVGTTVLEVVSGDTGTGQTAADAPATWFGLAVDVTDLDLMGAMLGDGLGQVKVAVQPGRRIATLRHKSFDMTVAVAAMDDHGDR